MMSKRGGLGRNLDALIPIKSPTPILSTKTDVSDNENIARVVPISSIRPNPKQPRTIFDSAALKELSDSIREVGLLQPPVVREVSNGNYELIMGERRFRASQAAGLREIPVIVRETSDKEMLREALIENIHRSELNALEEASAYTQLLQDLGVTHDELAAKVGKSRAAISNTIRLMHLPPSIQRKVIEGSISPGHARALLGLSNPTEMEALAKRIISENLSVRATEEIVAITSGKERSAKSAKKTDPFARVEFKELEERLENQLNTRVKIERKKIVIDYGDGQDLQRIVRLIEG
ncbi:MAG: ParB/RepB/Spo0J family partition protein [Actinobacteria bacterium]|nr:ParB/RepB/Spo0J family partition protein [Actinomycetota bacterium]